MRALGDLKREDGQLIMAFSALFTVVALFTGLAIDTGILYVTKAKLSSAVDSACLTAVKNLSQGETTATSVATGVFSANMGTSTISPTISYPTDQYGNQQVKVVATANVNTLFIGLLPRYKTIPVSAQAVATRANLIMSIVLDRSGSMSSNNGGTALQSAVPTFVGDFNNRRIASAW